METITIPSPSAFLEKSPVDKTHSLSPARATHLPKNPQQRPLASSGQAPIRSSAPNGTTTKPKQSKSRNGCITCKGKRLKCDESKPTCEQCRKRNVKCGGYSKAFKWRSFEEANFTGKSGPKPRKVSPLPVPPLPLKDLFVQAQGQEQLQAQQRSHSNQSDESSSEPPPTPNGRHDLKHSRSSSHGFNEAYEASDLQDGSPPQSSPQFPNPMRCSTQQHGQDDCEEQLYSDPNAPIIFPNPPPDSFSGPQSTGGLSQPTAVPTLYHAEFFPCDPTTLHDNLFEGTGLDSLVPPIEPRPHRLSLPYVDGGYTPPEDIDIAIDDEEDVEEILRTENSTFDLEAGPLAVFDYGPLLLARASPTPSNSSSSSVVSALHPWAQPRLAADFQGTLAVQFHRHTCGILSVKDGPNENPWRTVIWPLAQEWTHLYHAVASLTAFHSSKVYPERRVDGMKHMHKSVTRLAASLHNMSFDDWQADSSTLEAALATTLVLAFSESWDQHVSTGIKHLKGAKYFVDQVVAKHQNTFRAGWCDSQQSNRLKFLCNSYIYMDVIARLTSLEEDNLADFNTVLGAFNQAFDPMTEIDPLMGAASTLFPLIGHVAGIITRVRKSESNSFSLISDALELKRRIEQWQPPTPVSFEIPEDPTSEVQHSLQTAEAYRWATLLYLHQAVPEIPSEPAAVLADRVLRYLATVPLSSRSIIVQIYPFLAASCEAVAEEDRKWIKNRWAAMSSRMSIGNVDKCLEVVKEVWGRRDAFEAEKADRFLRRQAARELSLNGFYDPAVSWTSKRKASSINTSGSGLVFRSAGGPEKAAVGPGSFHKRRAMTGLPQAIKLNNHRNPASIHMDMDSAAGSNSPGLVMQSPLPLFSSSCNRVSEIPLESMELEYTVRGRLHWIGVMSDFGWEVFLG